jgi:hypothetical protein
VKRVLAILFLFLLAVSFWVWLRPQKPARLSAASPSAPEREVLATSVAATTVASPATGPPGQSPPLLGETLLRGYADPNLPPENDLNLMAHLMENSLLLLKSAANRPLGANEDWADLFRGKNSARERFLPDHHVALNTVGQLVDRWGTPLFFHALGGGRYEVRSSGPDKKPWTDDDIHRNADGSFRRGADLTRTDLLEAAARQP